MSVKVATRVRPFNDREKGLNATVCIKMIGTQTIIENPETNEKKTFTFDNCFWTHDGNKKDASGVDIPDGSSSNYQGQNEVFEALGTQVLDNAWTGYNCCLFAYGQTGSGKSYSMIGKPPNTGIVPRVTEEMFVRIEKCKSETKQFEVTYSMLEVYNEKVRDLLIPEEQSPSGGLKVRERPSGECYADGQKDMQVSNYQQIEKWMDYGNKNKTIGETKMNKESSRSHTVITLKFKQIELIGKKQSIKSPIINLVDLAGSEKTSQTGAEGDRLKEGIAINKSLTTLGMCINILSEKASGRAKKDVVPFRNSVLTRLLQNALGGNSKTIMVCALSPASSNYEETLNTLRYAERAKKIELKATIVESPQDKLIRELKDEIERLKGQMGGKGPASVPGASSSEEAERIKAELLATQKAMSDMQKSWEEKLEDAKVKKAEAATSVIQVSSTVDFAKPHIVNISEDPLLSGKIAFDFEKGPIHVGKKNGSPPPQIALGSIAIRPNHAVFQQEAGVVYLSPITPDCADAIFVNGKKIEGKVALNPGDRIVFGTNSAFFFKDPTKPSEANSKEVEYEAVMQEKYEKSEKEVEEKKEEERRKAEYERVKKELEESAASAAAQKEKGIKEEYETKLRELEEKNKKEHEERQQKKLNKKDESEKRFLDEKISKLFPLVREANLCAKEFKRNIDLELKLNKELPDWMGKKISDDLKKAKTVMFISVTNREEGTHYNWSEDKFLDRLNIIRDLINNYFDNGVIPDWKPENDPFWDEQEPELIGQGYFSLKNLAYLLDSSSEIVLFHGAKQVGMLKVKFAPTDSKWEKEPEDGPDDPREMLKKELFFKIGIEKATGLPKGSRDVFCQYKLPYPTQTFLTPKVMGINTGPEFKYEHNHSYDFISETLLNFILDSSLSFKVYGYTESEKIMGAPLKPPQIQKPKDNPPTAIKLPEEKKLVSLAKESPPEPKKVEEKKG